MSSAEAELDCSIYDDGTFSCSKEGTYYVSYGYNVGDLKKKELTNKLYVAFYGDVTTALKGDYKRAEAELKSFKNYIKNDDIKRYLLSSNMPYSSDKFIACMNAHGLEYFIDDENNVEGYQILIKDSNNEDEKEYLHIVLEKFDIQKILEKGGYYTYKFEFQIGPAYEEDMPNITKNNKKHEKPESDYATNIKANWKKIVEGIYAATVSYLKGEECDPVLAAKAAEATATAARKAEEKQILQNKKAKKTTRRKLIAFEKILKTTRKKLSTQNNGLANSSNINKYSSNEGYHTPTVKNVTLKSRIHGNNKDLPYTINIAINKEEIKKRLVDAGLKDIIEDKDISEKVYKPIFTQIYERNLCKGISANFVKKSIIGNSNTGHKSADIVLLMREVMPAETVADNTYVAGMATLIVKSRAIEVDVICSQVAYKMAGSLLMNKIVEIARALGKEKIELMSVHSRDTVQFYTRKFGFKRVKADNMFAMEAKRKGLIPLRRRVTRKKPAGGAGAKA